MDPQGEVCPFTRLPMRHVNEDRHTIYYEILILNKKVRLLFASSSFYRVKTYDNLLEPYHHIIIGLLYEGKLQMPTNEILHWDEPYVTDETPGAIDIKKFIDRTSFPNSPKEKVENLLFQLFALHKYEGEKVTIPLLDYGVWTTWYFRNIAEFKFYIETLADMGYIRADITNTHVHYKITFEGLSAYIRLFEEGYNSTRCFVAMAFEDATKPIREAIRTAVKATGYDPIFIDELNIESATTINDAIIANLKKCKFCVADFTLHKMGVYFESGFALGQGKQVIYTCRNDEFQKAHFDIRPLQHILYDTPQELEGRLKYKIEAIF